MPYRHDTTLAPSHALTVVDCNQAMERDDAFKARTASVFAGLEAKVHGRAAHEEDAEEVHELQELRRALACGQQAEWQAAARAHSTGKRTHPQEPRACSMSAFAVPEVGPGEGKGEGGGGTRRSDSLGPHW